MFLLFLFLLLNDSKFYAERLTEFQGSANCMGGGRSGCSCGVTESSFACNEERSLLQPIKTGSMILMSRVFRNRKSTGAPMGSC